MRKPDIRWGAAIAVLTLAGAPESSAFVHYQASSKHVRNTKTVAADVRSPHYRVSKKAPLTLLTSTNGNVVAVPFKSVRKPSFTTDSVDQFAEDVTTVLKTLRSEERDPTIPKLFRKASLPSFTHTWTLEDWEIHTSRKRYLNYFSFIGASRLFRRLAPQMTVVTIWSIIAVWLHSKEIGILHTVRLDLTPLSLVSTFVAALLTLRSNQGLDRLNQGRQSFGKVVLYTRDMASLIVTNIYPKDPQLALKLLRHVSLFGWLLKNFLRGEKTNGTDEDIIRVMLPHGNDAEFVMRQRKKPMAVVTRLRQAFGHMAQKGQLNAAEEIALDHVTQELNDCLMTTERIRASPIPPLYTAHAGRLLVFYLVFLPLALRGSGMLNGVGTVITSTAVGFAMLGLDEISHLLEQPFRLMPIYQLSKNAMIDVADCIVMPPPPLDDTKPWRVRTSPYW